MTSAGKAFWSPSMQLVLKNSHRTYIQSYHHQKVQCMPVNAQHTNWMAQGSPSRGGLLGSQRVRQCNFDAWQAIARIFRYGQTRRTYIYSLVYHGTMEEACYRRNVDKEGLSKKVVDSRTIKGARTAGTSFLLNNRFKFAGLHVYGPST